MQRDAIHLRRFSSGRLGYATRPLSTELPPPKRNLSPVTHCPVRAGSLVIAPAMISPLGSFFRFSRKGGRLTTAFVQRRTHNANQSRSTLATLTGHTIPLFWHDCLTRRRPNRVYQPFLPFGTAPTRRPLFPPSLASRQAWLPAITCPNMIDPADTTRRRRKAVRDTTQKYGAESLPSV
ncbi:uncharacterized protein CLUP02_16746 [Colletotrichum lupini]|uniref:Uncharacterized protein n=1 Tax=Colletotrichum lupini TaxID=145971 RepID=A0A9Q8T8P8_9PEZI|nr:uncharacterized protein CLUP02_16746 [Colletotrichum lupini]UQC91212.1 hypothetical protein CLUP02_16746 [Colletotrichum lupini]